MPAGRPGEGRNRSRLSNGDVQASMYDNEEDRFKDVSTYVSMLKYYLRSIAVLSCFILTSHSWTFLPIFFLSTFMVTDIFLLF